MTEKILITHGCAPGDITCLTGFPRDLALTYPDRFEVHVDTHCKTLWHHNPHVAGVHDKRPVGMKTVAMSYGRFIRQANKEKLHFVTAFHRDFQQRTKVSVPCLHAKGDLHLDDWHNANPPIAGRYWAIMAGGKSDFTTKIWSAQRWQQVVDKLRERGIQVVQCGARYKGHSHPSLGGVLDMVGETDLRELLWVIRHAEGCICPITFMMHASAAFDKPCVCIAGGREHWWWEAYVNVRGIDNFGPYAQPVIVPHRYLHTQDLLDCCKGRGCWKNKISRNSPDKQKSYCKMPVPDTFGQVIPKCLDMITADHVVEAVMSYYEDGTLPAIGKPKELVLPSTATPKIVTVAKGPVDLFAPADQILQATQQPIETVDDLPTRIQKFKGDSKPKSVVRTGNPYDDPIINGRLTICALMYGDFHSMHKACVSNILNTIPPERRQLRIATNAVCRSTRDWLDKLHEAGHIHVLQHNARNIKKYPAMRKLFHDPTDPIKDKWVVWFDDDSIANVDPQWGTKLCQKIISVYPECRSVGSVRYWSLSPTQMDWAKSRPWYRNRNWQVKGGFMAPNGQKIYFTCGGFWAMETAAMLEAGVPDEQLGHNGGDYILSAQLWQLGYKVGSWNNQKQFVNTSSVPRRGLNEKHTGQPGWKPGGVPRVR